MPRSIHFGSSACLLRLQRVCRYGASTGLLHGSADTDGFLLFTHRPPAWSSTSANGGLIPSSGPAAFAATQSGRHPLAPPRPFRTCGGRVRAMDHAPPGGLWHVSTPHRAPAQTMSTTPREHLRNGLGTGIVRPTTKAGISFFVKWGDLAVSGLFLLVIITCIIDYCCYYYCHYYYYFYYVCEGRLCLGKPPRFAGHLSSF